MADSKQEASRAANEAVGAYLRFLRDAAGISVGQMAEKVGIDQSQIWRIESGKTDTKGSFLFKFIAAVSGDPNDVALLINNPLATKDDGERIARLRRELIK
jgi:transcriptional regulator with XRE-family HTH domain